MVNIYLDEHFPITDENQKYFDFVVNSLMNFEDRNRCVVKQITFDDRSGNSIRIERKRNGFYAYLEN